MAVSKRVPAIRTTQTPAEESVNSKLAVREVELASFELKRIRLAELTKEARRLEKEVRSEQESLVARIEAGARVTGRFVATIEEKAGQMRPQWKEEFRKMAVIAGRNADAEEARVFREFVPSTSKVLVVTKKGR